MTFGKQSRKRELGGVSSIVALAVAIASLAVTAQAANYSGPFSSDGLNPTPISLSLGDNTITGTTGGFVSNYVTFTIAPGEDLTSLIVRDGSPAPDQTFIGFSDKDTVVVNPDFTSAAGLIGWTLYSDANDGENILPAIGSASAPDFPAFPGAPGFTGPLGPGVYSTWIVDGDGDPNTVPFSLDYQVSAAPEPGGWALLLAGVGGVGLALRRKRRNAGAGLTGASTV